MKYSKMNKKVYLNLLRFLKKFLLFIIDTNDDNIKNNISAILNSNKDSVKKIEIRTTNSNDINILICASFDEIINHLIFFDDNLNEIVILNRNLFKIYQY